LAVVLGAALTKTGCTQTLAASLEQQPTATTASDDKPKKTYKDLIVGYVQLGAESEWRSANTASVKEAAAQLGVELKFSDAQQKQENQIKAIRSLIAQKVDVIGVAPLTETGWDDVFKEARRCRHPDYFGDRRADVSPNCMYPHGVRLPGRRARPPGRWRR
jgi:simple sugar transport system substrate-binding protein